MSTINVTIRRYDPTVDEAPHYETYEVEWRENMSVLEVVRAVHENCEPIAFDYSCRGASCGLCGMKVNGKPVFACDTMVHEGEDLTIEPLDNFPVIRDLFVDKSGLRQKLLSIGPEFKRATPMTYPMTMDPQAYMKTAITQQCRECMLCCTTCPAMAANGIEGYAGPMVMMKLASRYFDEREGKQQQRLQEAVDQGLFNCIECGTCTSVCPKGEAMHIEGGEFSFIDHVRYITEMKEAAREAGLEPVAEEVVRPVDSNDISQPTAFAAL
ncbi:4Fe-4S dicluster domain-containing protein [bacterium]|nr:4Fe-4S dicluster domain-containing protein [bacterium]